MSKKQKQEAKADRTGRAMTFKVKRPSQRARGFCNEETCTRKATHFGYCVIHWEVRQDAWRKWVRDVGSRMNMNRTRFASSDGETASTDSVCAKKPTMLAVPIRDELTGSESIALGFRQPMVSCGGKKEIGSVSTGAGLGTDFIILEWRGRNATIRGSELLKAWVATFAPEDAKAMP